MIECLSDANSILYLITNMIEQIMDALDRLYTGEILALDLTIARGHVSGLKTGISTASIQQSLT